MRIKKSTLIEIAICVLWLAPQASFNQNAISLFEYLSEFNELEVTIEASFKEIFKKKDEYMPAHLLIKSGDQVLLDTMGEVRSRGNARKVVCYMPPTKIRVDKSYLKNRGWLDYPTLKVVNSCTYTDLAESYINTENLIYKIYNLLTDRSYRSKSVHLNYIDSDGKKKTASFDGFIIEHEDQMADRMHGEILDQEYFKPTLLSRENYIIFTVFQYLIGNTDWKVLNKHNLVVVKVEADRTCYAVPYDFDYAGIVNTSYAVPNEKLPIKSIKERIYLGPCQTQSELAATRDLFIEKKESIYGLIQDAQLNDKQEESIRRFIDEFYEIIDDEERSKRIFTNCIDY